MWNRIEDKKPKNGSLCVIKDENGYCYVGWYIPGRRGEHQWHDWKLTLCPCSKSIGVITHWMPLQELP